MLEYFLLPLGIALLVFGANYLVKGSSALAKILNIPSLVIGLTVVAFGTSMPELFVNLWANGSNAPEIAIGNIIGSNLINILLVLGITSLIYSIRVKKSTIWKEIPFSLLAAIVLLVLANDFAFDNTVSYISRVDGLILLLFFLIFIYYTYELSLKRESRVPYDFKMYKPVLIPFMIIVGIFGLFFGGRLVVDNAVMIASSLGISQFVISVTVISIGTTLPELTTSIVAAVKKNADLAVGNIVGSNIFNIFFVLGISAVVSPIMIKDFINFDLIMVIFATALLFVFALWERKKKLGKWQGAVLVLLYIVYIIMVIFRG
ncbi:MAG: calcium/sodium antiporter [archaeon]